MYGKETIKPLKFNNEHIEVLVAYNADELKELSAACGIIYSKYFTGNIPGEFPVYVKFYKRLNDLEWDMVWYAGAVAQRVMDQAIPLFAAKTPAENLEYFV